MKGTIRHSPDLYLDEIKELLEDRIGVEVDESTIWRSLRRSGFTIKKVRIQSSNCNLHNHHIQQLTREALKRSAAKQAAFRYEYGICYSPEQTVFVDESSFDRRTSIRGRDGNKLSRWIS